ncbi:hypothetical protein AB3S75_044841 [Citrus x aurantiifolia]
MSPPKIFTLLIFLANTAVSVSHGFEVSISNNLGVNTKLTVHCKNNAEDLGSHVLENDGEFKWDFSIGTGTPVNYYCDLASGSIGGQFNLFDENRDVARCGGQTCFWRVLGDGIYLFIKANNDYEKQFHW